MLYEDPELGFCILAHQYKGAKNSPPHDHGPSWAIYGQAKGETEMTDYALVSAASPEKPGKAKALRTYKLTPGSAYLYNEGDLHSPRRTGPSWPIGVAQRKLASASTVPPLAGWMPHSAVMSRQG